MNKNKVSMLLVLCFFSSMAFGCDAYSALYTQYDYFSYSNLYIQGPCAQGSTLDCGFYDSRIEQGYWTKINTLDQNDVNYSIKTIDMTISGATLSFDDISCLSGYFTEDSYYSTDIDHPFEFCYSAGTKTQLINDLSRHTDISRIVYCKSNLHYFDTGLTFLKITIIPDYTKAIVHVTIETWVTKNPSYISSMNVGIAATAAGIIYSLCHTQK